MKAERYALFCAVIVMGLCCQHARTTTFGQEQKARAETTENVEKKQGIQGWASSSLNVHKSQDDSILQGLTQVQLQITGIQQLIQEPNTSEENIKAEVVSLLNEGGIKVVSRPRSIQSRLTDADAKIPVFSIAIRTYTHDDVPLSSYSCEYYLTEPVILNRKDKTTIWAVTWQGKSNVGIIDQDALNRLTYEIVISSTHNFAHRCQQENKSSEIATQPKTEQASTSTIDPIGVANSISSYPFVASKNSEIFHKSTCPSAKRIAVGNIVGYKTRQEAIEAGKRPCKRCKP